MNLIPFLARGTSGTVVRRGRVTRAWNFFQGMAAIPSVPQHTTVYGVAAFTVRPIALFGFIFLCCLDAQQFETLRQPAPAPHGGNSSAVNIAEPAITSDSTSDSISSWLVQRDIQAAEVARVQSELTNLQLQYDRGSLLDRQRNEIHSLQRIQQDLRNMLGEVHRLCGDKAGAGIEWEIMRLDTTIKRKSGELNAAAKDDDENRLRIKRLIDLKRDELEDVKTGLRTIEGYLADARNQEDLANRAAAVAAAVPAREMTLPVSARTTPTVKTTKQNRNQERKR